VAHVVQKAVDRDDSLALFLDRDRCSVNRSGRAGGHGEVCLDMATAIELGKTLDPRVDGREMPAKEPEVCDGSADR
jgi:hypothetical protein